MARSTADSVEDMAEELAARLIAAIDLTLVQREPDPSRSLIASTLDIARLTEPDGEGKTTRLMVTLILIRWLSVVRAKLDDRPERVDVALGWIEESMGKRYAARARYTSPVLRDEEGASEILRYREALGDDFLPSLVWLLAGVVAAEKDGDVEWLERLVGVTPRPETRSGRR